MKKMLYTLLALAAVSAVAISAEVYPDFINENSPSTRVITYQQNWLANSDGTTTITLDALNGVVLGFTIVPKSGDNAPSADYDMTLTNSRGIDVLAGQGANLSATVAKDFWTSRADQSSNPMPITLVGNHTLVVTNAGDGGCGTIYIDVAKK